MARVQFGVIVTDITGSIGGVTFQRNRSGNIVRVRPSGKRKTTVKQQQSQSLQNKFLKAWQNLSFTEKTDWNDYADLFTKETPFGQTKTLTGLNWYTTTNRNRELFGQARIDVPPTHTLPSSVPAYTLEIDLTSIKITFSSPFTPANSGLLIRSTSPFKRVTTSIASSLRENTILSPATYTTIDITADWEATHGIPWPPSSSVECLGIGVMVQTVEITSGIQSVGEIRNTSGSPGGTGIGFMIIGSTFIVGANPGIGEMIIGSTFVVAGSGIGTMVIGSTFIIN